MIRLLCHHFEERINIHVGKEYWPKIEVLPTYLERRSVDNSLWDETLLGGFQFLPHL